MVEETKPEPRAYAREGWTLARHLAWRGGKIGSVEEERALGYEEGGYGVPRGIVILS